MYCRFGGGFTAWGQAFRLRHLLTGMFLGVTTEELSSLDKEAVMGLSLSLVGKPGSAVKQRGFKVALFCPENATRDTTAFCFVNSTVSTTIFKW